MRSGARKTWLRHVPLFGALGDCTASAHWSAIQETFIVLLFSTVPLWLGALFRFMLAQGTSLGQYWSAFLSTIGGGELFLYCTSLLAPILWIALHDPPGARKFPSRVGHIVLLVLINLIAAGIFGLQTGKQFPESSFVLIFSSVLFGISLLLVYLGTVYHISRLPDAPGEFKTEEEEYFQRFRSEEHGERD